MAEKKREPVKFNIQILPHDEVARMETHIEKIDQAIEEFQALIDYRMHSLLCMKQQALNDYEEYRAEAGLPSTETSERWTTPAAELTAGDKLDVALASLALSTRTQYLGIINRIDKHLVNCSGSSEITDAILSRYLEDRFEQTDPPVSPGTIGLDVRVLVFRAKAMGDPDPYGVLSRAVMKRIRREGASRAKGSVKELRAADVAKLVAHCEGEYGLRGIRDAAIFSLLFDGLLRVGELAALEVSDLEDQDDGSGLLTIRRSKTDQNGEGATLFISPPAMMKVRVWTESSRIGPGPLFRKVFHSGRPSDTGMHPRTIRDITKNRCEQCGLKGRYGGHSFRRGMAQTLTENREPIQEVARAGRWKSTATVLRYTETTDARRGAVSRLHESQNGQG